jgi:hypothetical protein
VSLELSISSPYRRPNQIQHRNRASRFLTISGFFKSHSQMTPTIQPSLISSAELAASRERLRAIFRRQYLAFVFGSLAPRAQSWPCQKQPCTKIILRKRGKTRSGFPGRSLRCSLKRKPMRCAILRTAISGDVSTLFTALMVRLRCSGVSVICGG